MKTMIHLKIKTPMMIRLISVICLLALVGGVLPAPPTPVSAQEGEQCPWMDTSLSADERAQLLLNASTLEQKMRWLVEQPANSPTQTTWSGGVVYPEQVPCTPIIQYTDGPAAISGGGTGITAFPAQIALTATWDQVLSSQKGQAQAYEAFYKHRNVLLGPGLASGRNPLNGRNSEYMGEDPLLGGLMAAAMIRGVQEGNPDEPVESVIKHYVANEQELDRQSSSSNIDERTLYETYALPYEIAIKEGDPYGVMCAFNQVNGVYSCENGTILNDILKNYIGFSGWVVSDFGAVHSVSPSLNAGLDQELNRPRYFTPDNLNAALAAGEITEAQIDEAAFRVVRSHIAAGLFDHPLPPEPLDNVSTPENQAVALQVAEEGSVLLKNEAGILPLNVSGKSIAVIGPTASNTPTDGVSAETACAYNRPGVPCTPVAPLDAITARAELDGNTVVFDNGSDLDAAAATAAGADVAIVFGYYSEGEGSDLPNLSLSPQTITTLFSPAAAGATNIKVEDFGTIAVGSKVFVGEGDNQEAVVVTTLGTPATNTTLSFDAAIGDTNIKVPSVGGLVMGDTLTIDSGDDLETVTVMDVGTAGATTASDATAIGETTIPVNDVTGFAVGDTITIDSGANLETAVISEISSSRRNRNITVSSPLTMAHAAGVPVAGSGITFSPALAKNHAAGAAVQNEGTGITFSPALANAYESGTTVFSSHGDDLISAVAAANPNTVVMLQTGGPVLMPWIDQVKGVFETWYAGQEMGNAIAALLWGDVNPSGKLPQTFPVSEADLPTAGSEAQYPGIMDENGIRQVDYTEGLKVGYRWYDSQGIEPLFPFGYGLSYTTFEYSHLQVTPVRVQSDKEIRVHFRVTNTGSVAGTEIAQVYLSLPAETGEPPKRLVGWARVTLEPGEHQNMTVTIDPNSPAHPLSYWNTNSSSWVTVPGTYSVMVGSSSRDLPLEDAVSVWVK